MKPDLHIRYQEDGTIRLSFRLPGQIVYGMGERYDEVDRNGLVTQFLATDHFTCQDRETYLPVPFVMTDAGMGAFIDSTVPMTLSAMPVGIEPANDLPSNAVPHSSPAFASEPFVELLVLLPTLGSRDVPPVRFYQGTPAEMLAAFVRDTGGAILPPKWSLGIWMSANRWNTQAIVEEQLEMARQAGYPVSVAVIEAWSDESTFHEWNPNPPASAPAHSGNPWPSPAAMIHAFHADNIKLVLWQIPVLKKLGDGHVDAAHEAERQEAIREGFVVRNPDGSPFRIPEGKWFGGSMLPDFTNPAAGRWWFEKRRHLLEAGIDGFKTDGGEMVYDPETIFHDGSRGLEMRNRYPALYTQSYSEFAGPERVLFSRAGTTGSWRSPMHWAGDQLSTWEEFRSVMRAGLSAGLSGLLFWTFDIAGFTGPLPTADLYRRATQTAVYISAMQWHSDMPSGQYGGSTAPVTQNNDRSPWNIAAHTGDSTLMADCLWQANWRMNLMPHVWKEAQRSVSEGLPLMRHLVLEYPSDPVCRLIEDQFLLGSLLVAPVLEANRRSRTVYLPEGDWMDLWTGLELHGARSISNRCGPDAIPVFLRNGDALPLNLGDSLLFGSSVGNRTDTVDHLTFVLAGETGETSHEDDSGNRIKVAWRNGSLSLQLENGTWPANLHFLSNRSLDGEGLTALGQLQESPYYAHRWHPA